MISSAAAISGPDEIDFIRGRPPVRVAPLPLPGRDRLQLARLAPAHAPTRPVGRPELGVPELQHRERHGRGHLLVVRGRNRRPRVPRRPTHRGGELAVRNMPRVQRDEPPVLLVVLEHAGQGAEAARVVGTENRSGGFAPRVSPGPHGTGCLSRATSFGEAESRFRTERLLCRFDPLDRDDPRSYPSNSSSFHARVEPGQSLRFQLTMAPTNVGIARDPRPTLKMHEPDTAGYYVVGTIDRIVRTRRPPSGEPARYDSVLVLSGLPLTAVIPESFLRNLDARHGSGIVMHGVLDAILHRDRWTKPRRILRGRLERVVEHGEERTYLVFSDVRPIRGGPSGSVAV